MIYNQNNEEENAENIEVNNAIISKNMILYKNIYIKVKNQNKINEKEFKNLGENKSLKSNYESNINNNPNKLKIQIDSKKQNTKNNQNEIKKEQIEIDNQPFQTQNYDFNNLEKRFYENKINNFNLNKIDQQKIFKYKEKKILGNNKFNYNNANLNYNFILDDNIYNDSYKIHIFLKNIGNTTYINCVLRCLANNNSFSDYYIKNKEYLEKYMEVFPISYLFSRIIVHLFPDPKFLFPKSYSLEKFHKVLIFLNPIFKGKSTKNVIDFLIYFIDQLYEDNQRMKDINKNINGNAQQIIDNHNFENYMKFLREKEYSHVFKEFSWINKKTEKCWGCNNKNIIFKSFLTYDLDFENALNKTIVNNTNELSVLDCIKYTSEYKNKYNVFCIKCHKKNNIETKSSIYSYGNTLILLIRGLEKKEIINEIQNNKIKIKINESFKLYNLMKNKYSYYTLHSLILYDTEKLEYIAYSINPINKKWYKYMKDEILEIKLNDFINEYDFKIFPVIFFYINEK